MLFITPLLIFYSSWYCLPDGDTFFYQKRKYPKKLALRDFRAGSVLNFQGNDLNSPAPYGTGSDTNHFIFLPVSLIA
jgi:hypothetical protein